jgi:hypothetical protein
VARQSPNYNREVSLELSLAATKALVSDYALRTRQAEEAFHRLVRGLEKSDLTEFEATLGRHINIRAHERTVHQQAILQATLIALGAALKAEPEERDQILHQMFKDLTLSVQHITTQAQRTHPAPASK